MATGRFVAYYRVSTQRQGRSGLGLEAQRKAVQDYLDGGAWELVAEYKEVESGKRSDRPELAQALAACRVHGATLVVAKLDRLSRDAAFLLTLRDAGVEFVAADFPQANRAMVGMMAVMAEWEREAISKRTSEALRAAKRRGVRLGTPRNLTAKDRRRGTRSSVESRRLAAAQRASDLRGTFDLLHQEGRQSLRELAAGLNGRRIPASRGGTWTAQQVKRVLARIA